MTKDEVARRVQNIERLASDDEGAHAAEDRLWGDVLRAIAEGAQNARELATEALKTGEIDFSRWCA